MSSLSREQKKRLIERVKGLDPKGEIVELAPNSSFTSGAVTYNEKCGLTLHEKLNRLNDEEYVRAYLVVRLVKHLRYPEKALELEKGYTIGRPTGKSAQLDVRVMDKRGKRERTFMLLEAKRPGDFDSYTDLIEDQLFAPGRFEHPAGCRYIVWYTVDFQGTDVRDRCIVIDLRRYHEFKEWVQAGEPGHHLDIPVEYGTLRKQRYVKGKADLRTDLTRDELTKLQKDLHNVLWGGGRNTDTVVFNNLLKLFLAKIYDEKTAEEGKPYRFQIDLKTEEGSEDAIPETPVDITRKVTALYQDTMRHYFGYTDEQSRSLGINENSVPPNKVAYVVERLEGISITENKFQDDVLGAFFEGIVRSGFKQEKGQFFTHSNIVRFIHYVLEMDEWVIQMINSAAPSIPFVIDPACGSGTFLIEAMKVMTNSVMHSNNSRLKKSRLVNDFYDAWFRPSAQNLNTHNKWAEKYVFGVEDSEDLAMAAKVNMILHGDGNANIQKSDGLGPFEKYQQPMLQMSNADPNLPYKWPLNEQFNCVVSNPPFSLKEEARTLTEYATRFAYAAHKNSENLFIERWYQLLKPGGRIGVVLPDSVFDTNENLYIRLFLYRFFWFKAVVSLPVVAFQPYTPTKTTLFFGTKKSRKEVEQWDTAWRKAANAYGKLRQSPIVRFVLNNDSIRSALIDAANKGEVEWYPATSLLDAKTLPRGIRKQIVKATKSGTARGRLAEALKKLRALLREDLLGTLPKKQEDEARATLRALLRDRMPAAMEQKPLRELVDGTYDDIVEAAVLSFTEDPKGNPYCNAWWCFAEVTSQNSHDYEIFFAEAEHVGYKRTTRHPEGIPRKNDLFTADDKGNPVINTERPATILDHIRAKKLFG
jgi:type I restriction enzyme M protein